MLVSMVMLAAATVAPGIYASPDYQAFRGCLARTVDTASGAAIIPEDLLHYLRASCESERAGLLAMAARRPNRPAAEDEPARAALVDGWTDELFVRAIRRYEIYYTTGLPLRQ